MKTYDPQELVRLQGLEAAVKAAGMDPVAAAAALSAKEGEIKRLGRQITELKARLQHAEDAATFCVNNHG